MAEDMSSGGSHTIKALEEFEILLDLVSTVSEGPTLESIVKQTLRETVRKLNLKGAAVFAYPDHGDSAGSPRLLASIPRHLERNPAYSIALERISVVLGNRGEVADGYCSDSIAPGLQYYVMELPKIGVLLLINTGEAIPPRMLWSLRAINMKWAQAMKLFLARQVSEAEQIQAAVARAEARVEKEKNAELRRANDALSLAQRNLHAQYEVARILLEARDLRDAAPAILRFICETFSWDVGLVWMVDRAAEVLRLEDSWSLPTTRPESFEAASRNRTFSRKVGLPGRVWDTGKPAWISEVASDDNSPLAASAAECGLHAAVAFPVRSGLQDLGVFEFFASSPGAAEESLLSLMEGIGNQIGQFVQRRRAEEMLAEKSQELQNANDELARRNQELGRAHLQLAEANALLSQQRPCSAG